VNRQTINTNLIVEYDAYGSIERVIADVGYGGYVAMPSEPIERIVAALLSMGAAQHPAGYHGYSSASQPANHATPAAITSGGDVSHDELDRAVKRLTRGTAEEAPMPTPCGWCGFTTGHAPSCAFVPRP